MEYQQQCQEILGEIATSLNMELAFDEHGICHLPRQSPYPVSLRQDQSRYCLALAGLVGAEWPENPTAELVSTVLDMAADSVNGLGPVLALAPETGHVCLYMRLPGNELAKGEAAELLGLFLLLQEHFISTLENVETGEKP